MTDVHLPHPSSEKLTAFGLGQLDEVEEAAIERHLADCAACRTVVENLPADTLVGKLQESCRPEACGAWTPPTGSWAGHEVQTLTRAPAASIPADTPPELAQHSRYRILQLLGAGGMGVVYKAEHQVMERPVALKVINPALMKNPEGVERFRREVKNAARLAHPNIVTAHDAEQSGEMHFLVMEYVEGTSLDKLVAGEGPLPVLRACDYVRQAALGLQHAFERGMVHRDIKPGNLMRTPEGRIKILDFGLARFARESPPVHSSEGPELDLRSAGGELSGASKTQPQLTDKPLTQVGVLMGTPDYMAPEQAASLHAADIRADIYSLGCTLYYLLAGTAPFPKGATVDKLLAHAEQTPRLLAQIRADIPPELTQIVDRMLAKDPMKRYQTPAEVAQALGSFLKAVEAGTVSLEAPAWPQMRPPLEEGTVQRKIPPVRRGGGHGWAVLAGLVGGAGGLISLTMFLQEGRENTMIESLETFYLVCALLGGTILICQFLLSLLGLGDHHEAGDHDFHVADSHDFHDAHDSHDSHDSHEGTHESHAAWYAGMFTFRTLVAALTFYGLAGRAAAATGMHPAQTVGVALAAGGAALFLVAWMVRSLYQLRSEGTVRSSRAIGKIGSVYLPIPAAKAGLGKIHLKLQNRTVEYQAVTSQAALPVGAEVMVVAIISSDTVEVIPAPVPEESTHV
jgi:serine/threonine protein kinase